MPTQERSTPAVLVREIDVLLTVMTAARQRVEGLAANLIGLADSSNKFGVGEFMNEKADIALKAALEALEAAGHDDQDSAVLLQHIKAIRELQEIGHRCSKAIDKWKADVEVLKAKWEREAKGIPLAS